MTLELLELIESGLTQDALTHAGEFFSQVDTSIPLRPEKLPLMHQLDELLSGEFATFLEELHRTLQRYESKLGTSVSALYTCGAGAQQFGLLRYLQSGH